MSEPEKYHQNAALQYLNLRGHFCWRNNTGGFKNPAGHFFRFGKKGSSDILGCSKDGKSIAIEFKAKGKKPTMEQINFLSNVNKRGGYGILAYSLDDVIKAGL